MSPDEITEREVENNKTYDMMALMTVAVIVLVILYSVAQAIKAGLN